MLFYFLLLLFTPARETTAHRLASPDANAIVPAYTPIVLVIAMAGAKAASSETSLKSFWFLEPIRITL